MPLPMPLYYASVGTAREVLADPEESNKRLCRLPDLKRIVDRLDEAVLFDNQIPAEINSGEHRMTDLGKMGVLRLPYPVIWMEHVIRRWRENTYRGALLYEGSREGELEIQMFRMDVRGGVAKQPKSAGRCIVLLADDWTSAAWSIIHPKTGKWIPTGASPPAAAREALFTLGLINCQNVTPVQTITDYPRPAARRRLPNNPRLSFSTIKIPGLPERGDGTSRAYLHAVSLHRVRGHFKTYTKDKPLMGKGVGTYWWGPQVRGNPAAGTVDSDYLVTDPGEQVAGAS